MLDAGIVAEAKTVFPGLPDASFTILTLISWLYAALSFFIYTRTDVTGAFEVTLKPCAASLGFTSFHTGVPPNGIWYGGMASVPLV